MKNKNNSVSVKVRKIVYDGDVVDSPKSMTVKANADMLEILHSNDDVIGNVDESEYIGELIEEKTGVPVYGFEYSI